MAASATLLGSLLWFGEGPMDEPVATAGPPPAPAEPVAPPPDLGLAGHIDLVLSEPFLAEANVGIAVLDMASHKTIYERGANVPLNPASNIKLVTTATALALLGPEYRYITRLYVEEDAFTGSTIKGNVYLRGSGAPDLSTEDMMSLAAELRARGIRKITGGIVVDSTAFDRDQFPPGFDQKEELASYRAMSSATSMNFNTFVIHVQPGATPGANPAVGVDPPVPSVQLTNEARTDKGYRNKLMAEVVHEKDGLTKIKLWGTIGADASAQEFRYPVADPSRYAGDVLALALRRNGIKLGRSRIKRGAVPPKAEFLASRASESMSVLIRSVNKYSNNFVAEQILKTLATGDTPATFATALERQRANLAEFGVPTKGIRLGNGSGLYDNNRISAAQIVRVIERTMTDFRFGSDYLASLAIFGSDGTTRRRLKDSPARGWVRAKTGTLDGVSGLSGVVGAPGRAPVVFSIIFNDLGTWDTGRARAAQDRIVDLLARHAASLPLVDPEPTIEVAEPTE